MECPYCKNKHGDIDKCSFCGKIVESSEIVFQIFCNSCSVNCINCNTYDLKRNLFNTLENNKICRFCRKFLQYKKCYECYRYGNKNI